MATDRAQVSDQAMRLLIVEDHALVREGLRMMASADARFGSVSETGSLAGALADLRSSDKPPALVMLDLGLPDSDGPSALRALRDLCPDVAILVVSGEDEPRLIDQSFALGARGYVPKNSSARTLRAAIETVLGGDLYVPPHVLPSQSQAQRPMLAMPATGQPDVRLTRRQSDVLLLLARGLANKEIAAELEMSLSTVRIHVGAVFKLLGVENRTQAAMTPTALKLLGARDTQA